MRLRLVPKPAFWLFISALVRLCPLSKSHNRRSAEQVEQDTSRNNLSLFVGQNSVCRQRLNVIKCQARRDPTSPIHHPGVEHRGTQSGGQKPLQALDQCVIQALGSEPVRQLNIVAAPSRASRSFSSYLQDQPGSPSVDPKETIAEEPLFVASAITTFCIASCIITQRRCPSKRVPTSESTASSGPSWLCTDHHPGSSCGVFLSQFPPASTSKERRVII